MACIYLFILDGLRGSLPRGEHHVLHTYNITFVPFLMDEYGHIGQAGLAFLSGLADRTARRRYEERKLTVPPGVMARQLYVRWRTFMTTELHGAMARIVQMLASRAKQGFRDDWPDLV